MAPLPQNNTNRLFFDYVSAANANGAEHTFQVRHQPAATIQAVQQTVFDFLTAITPARFYDGWRVVRCRFSGAGTNFSVPISLPANLEAFEGAGPAPNTPTLIAQEYTFQGRSNVSGRRVDVSLYGLVLSMGVNFRYTPAEQPWVGAMSTFLTSVSAGLGAFVAVDGTPAVWYPYLNANFNSYWERRVRLG